jgi:hypothetical protein
MKRRTKTQKESKAEQGKACTVSIYQLDKPVAEGSSQKEQAARRCETQAEERKNVCRDYAR